MIDSLRQARIRFVIKMRRSRLGLVIKIDVHRQVLNKIDGRVLCKIDVQTRALGEIVGWSQRHIGLVIKIVEQSQHKHSRSEELKQADGTEGAVCDIDVRDAKPVALRARTLAPQLREKLFLVIKRLLSAKTISYSTSPWA
ncbi:hypothetical protein L917_03352 [Phytophthora nicotianae]|uniref:Uncharacterized protein n=1 Tax=Phytophthora nicotianae TaxID=4792 RepID=W2LT82_PHYNI|nr:hypothetical protein L917_03352 [Phytophthora nicotianae]